MYTDRMRGRTAIITGSASGIGAASARRLASEGARVVVADINLQGAVSVADEINASGGDAFPWGFDLRDEDSIKALVTASLEHYGTVQVLHNNAADVSADLIGADGPVGMMDTAVWDRTFQANIRGVMLTIKHALPALIRTGNAAIINTSSGAAFWGDLNISAYAASKGALNTLTRYVATQYGRLGVRCNAVSPGQVITPGVTLTSILPAVRRHTLTPRLGKPEDIAAMVALLASADGEFITGQIVVVDGGIGAHGPHVADTYEEWSAKLDFGTAG
jgi:NAD(P)-dependent dehydrogenase (short-subunit alcohol dehydrogenase family)